jgi:hypothetical protein
MNIKKILKNGYLLHETISNGEKVAIIATGIKRITDNRKTGNMIQIWIILADQNPVASVQSGLDASTICQGCPFASGNGCYVNVGQAPLAVWKAYKKGSYPKLSPKDYNQVFNGRKVRFGAYGNPTLIPLSMVKSIASVSDGWTGYFHNWRELGMNKAKAYNQYFMASTESESSYELANTQGLRVFHASIKKPVNTVECLSDTHNIACADCQLCQGWNKRAKNVWINPHGSGVKKAIEASK